MGLFSNTDPEPIIAVREAYDRGDATAADLIKVVGNSTAATINEAMDRYGDGTESWARIR